MVIGNSHGVVDIQTGTCRRRCLQYVQHTMLHLLHRFRLATERFKHLELGDVEWVSQGHRFRDSVSICRELEDVVLLILNEQETVVHTLGALDVQRVHVLNVQQTSEDVRRRRTKLVERN